MPLLSANPMWEAFGTRAMLQSLHRAADVGECAMTVERVGDAGSVDDWHREWAATADRVEEIARGCAARGHAVSARDAFLRASTYHRTSYWPLFGRPADPRLTAASEREAAAFAAAADLMNPPVRAIEVPFEGTALPALLAVAGDDGAPRPTIVHVNGYDSTIHESFFALGPAGLARGYNVLCFDGPGQGRPLVRDGLTMRPDWENVVRPVIDHILELPVVDPDRLILSGWSFGGFLAPRAAAFEDRLAALIADPGQWDQRQAIVGALPLSDDDKARFPDVDPALLAPMEAWLSGPEADPMLRWRLLRRGLWVSGADSLFDYLRGMLDYEVSSVAGRIRCPALLTAAEGDPMAAGADPLAQAIGPGATVVRFSLAEGAGGHCEGTARTLFEQRVFDWLDETLDGR
jgi:Alpha/beta hydrolase family